MEIEMISSTRIYRLRPIVKGIIIFILTFTLGIDWLMLFVFPLVTNATRNHDLGAILTLLFGVGISLTMLYVGLKCWNVRLELSPEGVTLYSPPFYNIYTPWQNVTGLRNKKGWEVQKGPLGTKRFVKTLSGKAFVLREPAKKGISISEGRLQEVAAIKLVSLLPRGKDWAKEWDEIPFDPFQFFKNQEEKEKFYMYIRAMTGKDDLYTG